jgi:hypothetical protein
LLTLVKKSIEISIEFFHRSSMELHMLHFSMEKSYGDFYGIFL